MIKYHFREKSPIRKIFFCGFVYLIVSCTAGFSQTVQKINISAGRGLKTSVVVLADSSLLNLSETRALYSFVLDGKPFSSADAETVVRNGYHDQVFSNGIKVSFSSGNSPGVSEIVFENTGSDTVTLSNVVPFGESNSSVYITAG
jgi:hypothetical protein